MVRADPQQMDQVITSLLDNAREAMPEGGILRITTRLLRFDGKDDLFPECGAGDYLRIQVADTGVGMPEKVLTRVFDPFFTTKSPGGGAGLGLAACRGIIENHGGIIRAASVLGKGSVLTILLPVILSYEPPAPPSQDHH
jgi:signal transduction histidine kinase